MQAAENVRNQERMIERLKKKTDLNIERTDIELLRKIERTDIELSVDLWIERMEKHIDRKKT